MATPNLKELSIQQKLDLFDEFAEIYAQVKDAYLERLESIDMD